MPVASPRPGPMDGSAASIVVDATTVYWVDLADGTINAVGK